MRDLERARGVAKDGHRDRHWIVGLVVVGAGLALFGGGYALNHTAVVLISPQYQAKNTYATVAGRPNGATAEPSGGGTPRAAAWAVRPNPASWYHARSLQYQLRPKITDALGEQSARGQIVSVNRSAQATGCRIASGIDRNSVVSTARTGLDRKDARRLLRAPRAPASTEELSQ
jgi:hypothetical protein